MQLTITLPEQVYAALKAAAKDRQATPEQLIATLTAAWIEDEQLLPDHPLTEEEFAAVLGLDADTLARAEAASRRFHPDIPA